jgi:hypothetical protein
MSPGACSTALETLLRDGLARWSGLPRGCRPDEVGPVLVAAGEPGMWNLGGRKAFFRSGELDGVPAQLWTSTDDAEVLMIAVEDPPFARAPQAVREQLGGPALELDTARGTVPVPAGEWVYPDRGVAVFVDLDDQIFRATLFPACSPQEYETEFRVVLKERRQPLR